MLAKFIADFEQAYADVLLRMCNTWVYSCDKNLKNALHKTDRYSPSEDNAWIYMYSPCVPDMRTETAYEAVVTMYLKNEQVISKENYERLLPFKRNIDVLLQDSYIDVLSQSGSRWHSLCDGSVDHILHIIEPFQLHSSGTSIKFSFRLSGFPEVHNCGSAWWVPHHLLAYRQKITADAVACMHTHTYRDPVWISSLRCMATCPEHEPFVPVTPGTIIPLFLHTDAAQPKRNRTPASATLYAFNNRHPPNKEVISTPERKSMRERREKQTYEPDVVLASQAGVKRKRNEEPSPEPSPEELHDAVKQARASSGPLYVHQYARVSRLLQLMREKGFGAYDAYEKEVAEKQQQGAVTVRAQPPYMLRHA